MSSRWGYKGKWINASEIIDPSVAHRAEDLPVGVYLQVEFKGDTYTTFIVPPVPDNRRGHWRYVYKGERYKTLSAVAQKITGDPNLNGNRFWRLRRRKRGVK